jgi:hypothetical protein
VAASATGLADLDGTGSKLILTRQQSHHHFDPEKSSGIPPGEQDVPVREPLFCSAPEFCGFARRLVELSGKRSPVLGSQMLYTNPWGSRR